MEVEKSPLVSSLEESGADIQENKSELKSERKRLQEIPGRNLRWIQEDTVPCQIKKSPGAASLEGSGAGFPPESLGWARGGGCSRNGPLQHKIPAGKDGMLSSPAQELEELLFQRLLGT